MVFIEVEYVKFIKRLYDFKNLMKFHEIASIYYFAEG